MHSMQWLLIASVKMGGKTCRLGLCRGGGEGNWGAKEVGKGLGAMGFEAAGLRPYRVTCLSK